MLKPCKNFAAGGPPYIKDARLRRSPPALGASGAVSAIVIADVLLNPWRMVRCRADHLVCNGVLRHDRVKGCRVALQSFPPSLQMPGCNNCHAWATDTL